nr:reverse transcriptase domain-containing protein [Tanacetum cinerariifolium]
NEGNSWDRSHSRGRSRRRSSSSRDCPRNRNRPRGIEESYSNTRSSYRTGDRHGYHARYRNHSCNMKRRRGIESPLSRMSESGTSDEGHWKTKAKRRKPADEEDLSVLWTCEDVDPFTSQIRNFKSSRKTRMPNNMKTYDGTEDPKDHLKIFQAAAQVEPWAMHTWCHMFNSTLIGAARVWFDELPPESIDGYKGLKAAFLGYFMQQKKEPLSACESLDSCMVNNLELTKRLNERVPKTVEEMMTVTKAFIRRETTVASKKKVHSPWKSQDQSKRHTSERRSDFRNQPKDERGSNKFTPLTKTPKEIFTTESGKFKPPPPMVTLVEKRSSNKFCEFHNDKGHNTDECVQLRKQIEELVRAVNSRTSLKKSGKIEINKRLEKGRSSQRQSRSHLYDTTMAESNATEGDTVFRSRQRDYVPTIDRQ